MIFCMFIYKGLDRAQDIQSPARNPALPGISCLGKGHFEFFASGMLLTPYMIEAGVKPSRLL